MTNDQSSINREEDENDSSDFVFERLSDNVVPAGNSFGWEILNADHIQYSIKFNDVHERFFGAFKKEAAQLNSRMREQILTRHPTIVYSDITISHVM